MTKVADRNQRQLLELLKCPGNELCADCNSKNPRWSSYNFGIFICVQCAGIHRKMGTHISKVKSLTLDTWSREQVDFMRSNGNALSNSRLNPDERRNRPPTSIDEHERNSQLEKYIRLKYETRSFAVTPSSSTATLSPSSNSATSTRPPNTPTSVVPIRSNSAASFTPSFLSTNSNPNSITNSPAFSSPTSLPPPVIPYVSSPTSSPGSSGKHVRFRSASAPMLEELPHVPSRPSSGASRSGLEGIKEGIAVNGASVKGILRGRSNSSASGGGLGLNLNNGSSGVYGGGPVRAVTLPPTAYNSNSYVQFNTNNTPAAVPGGSRINTSIWDDIDSLAFSSSPSTVQPQSQSQVQQSIQHQPQISSASISSFVPSSQFGQSQFLPQQQQVELQDSPFYHGIQQSQQSIHYQQPLQSPSSVNPAQQFSAIPPTTPSISRNPFHSSNSFDLGSLQSSLPSPPIIHPQYQQYVYQPYQQQSFQAEENPFYFTEQPIPQQQQQVNLNPYSNQNQFQPQQVDNSNPFYFLPQQSQQQQAQPQQQFNPYQQYRQ